MNSTASAPPIRLCIIGFGWFAELLARRVLATVPGLEVAAIVDPAPDRRARAADLGLAAVTTLAELPSGLEVDAVAVLTPHDTHRGLVEEAAKRGLHVFCEKAFAVTSEDCLAMIEACRTAGVVLAVGHMQKLFPAHKRTVELARSGEYGGVASIHVDGQHWCPVLPGWWRRRDSCGGLLYWTGIHDLDTMRAVVGAEAISVYATTARPFDHYSEHENAIAVTIRYANGAVGTINVGELNPVLTFEESFSYAVLLEAGGIRMNPGNGTVMHARRDDLVRGDVASEFYGSFESMEEAAYRTELLAFVEAVRRGGGVDASAIDGLRCVETLEAIYRSVLSGQPEAVVCHQTLGDRP